MTSLSQKLTALMGATFKSLDLPADLGVVRISDRPDLAQFQCNGAMACAKIAKKNPREIADSIVEALGAHPEFSKIEIAGPGFINLNLTPEYIAQHLSEVQASQTLGLEKTGNDRRVILDYGGMNVAKAMHVGHLRPNVIGDCLRRIMIAAGYNALGDIHLGDWGLQMGQIISEFEIRHPEWPYFNKDMTEGYPEYPPFSYPDLERIYPEASAACKSDIDRLETARQATVDLQEGRAGYRALWQHFMALSIKDIKTNIAPLNVHFDIWKGESDVNDLIPEIAADLKSHNITVESDGATVIHVAREEDKKEMPPLMFFKSDGAQTYGTTDIGTIYDRLKEYDDIHKMIYIVDTRQSLHFEQVFRACKIAGYGSDVDYIHIGNGTVNGTDGTPFKTRDGGVMKFADMVASAIEKANARLDEVNLDEAITAEERADIARAVGISALKYTELSNQPHMDYVFDLDRMISFEGKTGPYLLYQAVRIKSLLAKAGEVDLSAKFVIAEEDQNLALLLAEFPDHFRHALNNLTPHVLCDYVYKLAQGFSSFYAACHILSETDADLRNSRLALCDLTYRQIECIMNLLGIDIPARM